MSSNRVGNLSIPGWVADLDGAQTITANRNDGNEVRSAGNQPGRSQSDSVEALDVVDDFEGTSTDRIPGGTGNEAARAKMDSVGGSGESSQLPVDSAGIDRVDDFDHVPNNCNGFGGKKASGTIKHNDFDKNSGLTKELQSMLTDFQDCILERLNSQFSSCEQKLIENIRDNFNQLSLSSTTAVATRDTTTSAAPTDKDDPLKKLQSNAKFKKAWKGVLAGIEQKKVMETLNPKPPNEPHHRAGIAYPEPPDPGVDLLAVLPQDAANTNDGEPAGENGQGALNQLDPHRFKPPRRSKLQIDGKPAKQHNGIFANSDDMKEKLRREMLLPKYEVSDLYKDTGFCQKIARSQFFEYVTLAVISINAVWMAIDIDYNKETVLTQAHPVFQIGEHLFCLYFTGEWIVRFAAFRVKRSSLTDKWFCLDSFLVAMMIFETWVMTVVYLSLADSTDSSSGGSGIGNASIFRLVRLVRLTRMARLAKLLRAMPELMTIVKGMFIAARTVFFMLCLLVCTVYVFAIAFRQITEGTDVGDEYFSTVINAMSSLLLRGNLPDVQNFVDHVSSGSKGGSPFYGVLLMVFICIGYVTLLNMLVGVLVSVVTVTAAVEKEQLTIVYVKDMMERAFRAANIGTSDGDTINVDDFVSFISHPDAYKALASVDVDVVGLLDFSDFIFQGNAALTFHDFVEIVLRLRGSNKATVKDMVDLRLFLGSEIKQLKAVLLDQMVTK